MIENSLSTETGEQVKFSSNLIVNEIHIGIKKINEAGWPKITDSSGSGSWLYLKCVVMFLITKWKVGVS
jgi:hypothetical protein